MGQRVNMYEEGGIHFAPFGEQLRLKEVIARVRFSMGKRTIEDALDGNSEGVMIVKVARSVKRFEIVVDSRGFE